MSVQLKMDYVRPISGHWNLSRKVSSVILSHRPWEPVWTLCRKNRIHGHFKKSRLTMKTNEKELYEAPLTMSLKFVGGGQIICSSFDADVDVEDMDEEGYTWQI